MLDIVSVVYNDEDYLYLNYILTKSINKFPIDWYVVKNSPHKSCKFLYDNFKVLDGAKRRNIKPLWANSFNHGDALNLSNPHIKNSPNKFVLYLDPDFYIIPSLLPIIDYIENNKLDFFGASYHPFTYETKKRDFPVCFCLFIDKTKIDISTLDFTPGWHQYPKNPEEHPDTSYLIYKKYKKKSKFESAIGVKNCTIEYIYNIKQLDNSREYLWKDKAFGIHARTSSPNKLFKLIKKIRRKDNIN